MGDYFHGWRRKIGVLTLVMACVFVGLWGRGQSKDNYRDFSLPFTGRIAYGIRLNPKTLQILKYTSVKYGSAMAIGTEPIGRIDYWRIVAPLTMLSTWLLLVKPQKNEKVETPST